MSGLSQLISQQTAEVVIVISSLLILQLRFW